MTFVRAVFIFAFLMLIVGAVLARLVIGPLLFGDVSSPSYSISARIDTPTPSRESREGHVSPARRVVSPTRAHPTLVPPAPTATATVRPTPPAATPRATVMPAARPTAGPTVRKRAAKPKHIARKRLATPQPTATLLPTAMPTATPSGSVTLANYWVGSTTTRPGTTIAVGYVIDNQTGSTARVELGASVKASNQFNWATDSISDPGHDVVAIVPPGVSRHVRFFTLGSGLRAGPYDIAWGLRDPSTGSRVALVAAPSALRVQRVIPAP